MDSKPNHFFQYFSKNYREALEKTVEELRKNVADSECILSEYREILSALQTFGKRDDERFFETLTNFGSKNEQLINALKSVISAQLDDIRVQLEQVLKNGISESVNAQRELQKQVENANLSVLKANELAIYASGKTDEFLAGISSKLGKEDWLVNVQFEREYYKDFPLKDENGSTTFRSKLLTLLQGLDEKSIETVIIALQRLRLIRESKEPLMYLYSEQERAQMSYLPEHFFSNIYSISDDCWYYRGMMLPEYHFEPCVFVDNLMLPELDYPDRFSEKDIIDAGAFIGDSALMLSPLTTRKVYAFEPAQINFERMLKTIEINKLKNVVALRSALSEKNGRTIISINDSASTQYESKAFAYISKEEAETVKLDDFVRDHCLQVGLIKADIEGAERFMLRGAEETLRKQKPALLISIYHNAEDFFGIKPWLESLNLGYKFKIRHSTSGTVMTETVLIAEVR